MLNAMIRHIGTLIAVKVTIRLQEMIKNSNRTVHDTKQKPSMLFCITVFLSITATAYPYFNVVENITKSNEAKMHIFVLILVLL
jgi:hypothetical protein